MRGSSALEISHHVSERDIIAVFLGEDGNGRPLDFDGRCLCFAHSFNRAKRRLPRILNRIENSRGLEHSQFALTVTNSPRLPNSGFERFGDLDCSGDSPYSKTRYKSKPNTIGTLRKA